MAMLAALSALAGCQTLLDLSLGSNTRGDQDFDEPGSDTPEPAIPALPVAPGDKPFPPLGLDAGSEATATDAGEQPGDDGEPGDYDASGDPDDYGDPDGYGGPDGDYGGPDGPGDDGPRGDGPGGDAD